MKISEFFWKSLAIATVIEIVVLALTLYPMADGFMVHSAVAAAQQPILTKILGGFGIIFHLPSILLTFWFLPLAPFVQIFIISIPIYFYYKFSKGFSERITTIGVD